MKYAAVYGLVRNLPFDEAVSKLKEAGYDGVELESYPVIDTPCVDSRAVEITDSEIPSLLEKAAHYREMADNAGIEVMGFAPGNFTMSYFEDGFFENYYRLAAALGSKNIKIAGTLYRPSEGSYWSLLKENQRKLKILSGYGEKYGVRSLVELHHGYLNESCSGAYRIVKDFDPTLVGVIHDPQNMIISGKENWRMGLEILGVYTAYVHFKNSAFKKTGEGAWLREITSLKEGLVDWKEFIRALKDTGFDGYLCNEYRGDTQDVPMEYYLVEELNYVKDLVSGEENDSGMK